MSMQCVTSSDYGSAASQVTVDAPDAVICTSRYSEELPYTMGLVTFAVTEDRSVNFSCSSSPSQLSNFNHLCSVRVSFTTVILRSRFLSLMPQTAVLKAVFAIRVWSTLQILTCVCIALYHATYLKHYRYRTRRISKNVDTCR